MPNARPESIRCRWCMIALSALLIAPLTLAAQGPAGVRDLVDAALDQKVTDPIEIRDTYMRQALRQIEDRTGLRFVVDPHAIEWMPHGERTRVSITIEDISVRQALRRILTGLGLRMRVAGDKVVVEPAPVLARTGRRLALSEVKLIQRLAEAKWAALEPPPDVQFDLPPDADRDAARTLFESALRGAVGDNALEQIENALPEYGWWWVPRGEAIVVRSQHESIQERLTRRIDLHYQQVPLDEFLLSMADRANIVLHFEPGVLERINARDRKMTLIQRDIMVGQVLELVMGSTGLVYDVVDDGVVISAPPEETARADRPRVVAILRVPMDDGTTFDVLIREDHLPPEYQTLMDRLLERKLPEVIDVLRARVGD